MRHFRLPWLCPVGSYPCLVCLSDSEDIRISVVETLLASEYDIYQLFVSPTDCGHHGVQRKRTYIYCCHKQTGSYMFDVWEAHKMVSRAINKVVSTAPNDYLLSTPRQILADAAPTAAARKKALKPEACSQSWEHSGTGSGIRTLLLAAGRLPQP